MQVMGKMRVIASRKAYCVLSGGRTFCLDAFRHFCPHPVSLWHLLLFLLCIPIEGKAQDPLLSISQVVPLYLNPASTGNEYYTRVALDYRNHFPGIGNSFVTYSASFDMYLDNYNSGIGLMLIGDQLGSKAFTYTSAAFSYAYRIQMGRHSALRAGLMGSYYYASRNPNDLVFPDMVDNEGALSPNSLTYARSSYSGVDFGTGVTYETDVFKVGAAVYHLGSPGDSAYWHRPLKLFTHAEMRIPLSGNEGFNRAPRSNLSTLLRQAELRPILYFLHQGQTNLFGLGSYFQFGGFNTGLFARQDFGLRSMTFSVQVGYSSDLLEAYYMMDIGSLGATFSGMSTSSHELGIIIRFATDKNE